jgi:hypothetical protein
LSQLRAHFAFSTRARASRLKKNSLMPVLGLLFNCALFVGTVLLVVSVLHTYFPMTYLNREFLDTQERRLEPSEFPTHQLLVAIDGISPSGSTAFRSGTHQCSICMERKKTLVCVPCGHTFCAECPAKRSTCLICSAHVRERVKMFL